MSHFVARLRAAIDRVEVALPEDGWAEHTWRLESFIPEGLLTMRRIRLASTVLARIARAAEALSWNHAIKRMYRSMSTPLHVPVLENMKRGGSSTIRWGGTGAYFDWATGWKAPEQYVKPKLWRDPFVA